MENELHQELTGWGTVVRGDTTYKKIYYRVIIEKEGPDDDEPDIYGTVNDKRGDPLDLSDGRFLKIVFLDESDEFEVVGGFRQG